MKKQNANEIEKRLASANELLKVIASCGRRFFHCKGRVSRLERDSRGRIWFIDAWRGRRVYTHYRGEWRGFSEGGTLKELIIALRDFIVRGNKIWPTVFGPWPDIICDGDLWGYGDDMVKIRDAAARLQIV